jgi:hypothetical protein
MLSEILVKVKICGECRALYTPHATQSSAKQNKRKQNKTKENKRKYSKGLQRKATYQLTKVPKEVGKRST